jgi:hypothetical protein
VSPFPGAEGDQGVADITRHPQRLNWSLENRQCSNNVLGISLVVRACHFFKLTLKSTSVKSVRPSIAPGPEDNHELFEIFSTRLLSLVCRVFR